MGVNGAHNTVGENVDAYNTAWVLSCQEGRRVLFLQMYKGKCYFLFLLVFFVAQAGISLLGEVNLVCNLVDNQRSYGAKIARSIFRSEAGSVCHSPPER